MFKFSQQYFVEKFTPLTRHLHYLLLIFVLLQIILSNFLEIDDNGEIGHHFIEYSATWAHITIGLSTLLLSFIFIHIELKKHGVAYFYPYLWGDLAQLKEDINTLKTLNFPKVSPKGLAATVQGLGLGALLCVTLSGATWFLLWFMDMPFSHDAKEIHELFTGLIEAYIIAHGGMGVMHILIAYIK